MAGSTTTVEFGSSIQLNKFGIARLLSFNCDALLWAAKQWPEVDDEVGDRLPQQFGGIRRISEDEMGIHRLALPCSAAATPIPTGCTRAAVL
jgi:hypothetical protein